MRTLSLVFSLFFALGAQASSFLPHLAEGRPGCFELFRNQALTDSQIQALPVDCQALRSDYIKSLDLIAQSPETYSKNLSAFLSSARTARAPYEAILFAFLLNHRSIKNGLDARAKTEKKLKVPFQYAVVASAILSGKECVDLGKGFQSPEYSELCTSKDPIITELYLAHQKRSPTKQ
jgi:hypothetical protein